MAILFDPDNMTDGQEIQINADAHTVRLSACGNLTTEGVTVKCVYSKLKDLWKENTTYIKYPFPMVPITDEQFEMVNTWDWFDDPTRYLLRTGGWAKKSPSGVSEQEWAGIIGLGTLVSSDDQVYFQQAATGPASAAGNFQLTGQVNQAISVYSSAGGTDYRSYLKLFCREWGKSYAFSQLSDIGVSTLTYQAYRFPLANSTDIKITHAASAVSGDAPYASMTLSGFAAPQSRTLGASAYNFHVIIVSDAASSSTAEQIYEFVQYELTKSTDIDDADGVMVGKTAPLLLSFVGDTLYTLYSVEASGVYIDNFKGTDINRLIFDEENDIPVAFPYTAQLTLNFGSNVQNDTSSQYWVFFTDIPSGNYGDDDAYLVNDAASTPMTGAANVASVTRSFAYDTNNQGGRTPVTQAAVTAVAIGLSGAQFISAESTIDRSITNSVSLVAPLERNYTA